jgi:hypothetical protein
MTREHEPHHKLPQFPARFVRVPEARLRFGDRVDRVGAFLWKPDALADAVIAEIESLPPGEGWKIVEEACAKGIDAISRPPPAIATLFAQTEAVPAWVDWETVHRGGAVLLRAGILGGVVLGSESLPLGYASPGGNKPLVMSGRLEKQALRRLNETARFVQAVCRKNGMKPRGEGYHITVKVRLMHAQVRSMILRSGKWKPELWGLPVNQHDMGGTGLLFSLILLDGLRKLGMVISDRDAEAYMHLWRWVSHVIGVDTEIAPTSEADGNRLAALIRATEADPDADSRALMRALLFAEVNGAKTRERRRVGRAKAHIGAVFTRMLCGDDIADKLGVERTPLELTRPLLRRLVKTGDFVMRNVPGAEKQALAVGIRYWDRVIEIGLAGAMAEFGLPDSLAA